jgi:hypothetical protein
VRVQPEYVQEERELLSVKLRRQLALRLKAPHGRNATLPKRPPIAR